MRTKLSKYLNERRTFSATVQDIRTNRLGIGMSQFVVLSSNIKDQSGAVLCDHLWIRVPDKCLEKLIRGDIIKFSGVVKKYIKKHVDRRVDYCIDHIFDVEKIDIDMSYARKPLLAKAKRVIDIADSEIEFAISEKLMYV